MPSAAYNANQYLPATYSSDLFSVHKDGEAYEMTAEYSMLGHVTKGKPVGDPVRYGFYVKSTRTGAVVKFLHRERVTDLEGELMYDVFVPANPGNVPVRQVTVFND
jgi:hypothetical protein